MPKREHWSLTEEQKKLAADNYKLISWYLNKHDLYDVDDWEACAIGLCRAARSYDPSKGRFSTFATRSMWQEVTRRTTGKAWENEKLNRGCASLFQPVMKDVGENDMLLIDAVPNEDPAEEDWIDRRLAREFFSSLTPKEQDILRRTADGYTQRELAPMYGVTFQRIEQILRKIRQNGKKYIELQEEKIRNK